MGTSIASAAERVPGAEKAPIALIKGMNGEVVGGQLEKVPAKSAWGGALSRDTRQWCLWRNDSLGRGLVLVQEL